MTATYFTDTLHLCYRREDNASSPVKIVYTPMHGVGAEGAREAFRAFSLPDFIPVPEQVYTIHSLLADQWSSWK